MAAVANTDGVLAMGILDSIRENKMAMMALCVALPLLALAAIYLLGLQANPAFFTIAILLCPLSHILLHLAHDEKKHGDGKACH